MNDADLERIAAAAKERSGAVATRADRPSQRRSAEHKGSGFAMPARASVSIIDPTEATRAADAPAGPLHFHGLASAYETPYEMWDWYGPYIEIVSAGAGAQSLARADLDVPLVLQHMQLRRLARTNNDASPLFLTETAEGLDVDAPTLDPKDWDVSYIAPKILAQLVDEMSFAFRIELGTWSPDWMTYRIERYDIHRGDVAIVGFGANPYTISELRAAPATQQEQPGINGRSLVSLDETRLLPTV